MRRALALVVAVTAFGGTADAAAPVRGGAFCWDFDQVGTDAAERFETTAASEHVAAYAGADELLLFGGDDCAAAGAGDDRVHLGPGDDEAAGGAGADELYGGPGNDVLLPGLGADRADGGDGDDLIRDERGDADRDVLIAGEGDDVVRALNGAADGVECGPGYDVAIVDAADTTSECERVEVAHHPRIAARSLRTGVRPSFTVTWTRADLVLPARLVVELVDAPSPRRECGVMAWRARGGKVVWRGLRRACPGEYAFALTYVDARPGGPRVACDRLAGAPRGGCTPSESLGVLTVPVR
ncbi:MAG TPA: hypothetical protein VF529_22615 [Solirubrobacteraceae bacterium]|jgi:hypothetical protein